MSPHPDFPVYRRRADAAPGWETVSSHTAFDNPYIRIEEVRLRTPTHVEGDLRWTIARRKSGVVIAPRLKDGRFLLIHQERYPIERTLWEFPAGQIDDLDGRERHEVILDTARRELEEETNHRVPEGGLVPLGYFFCSQGFTDEHCYLFLADGVEPLEDRATLGEGGEAIHEVRAVESAELRAMIARHEIVDGNTLSACARMQAMGLG